MRVLWLIKGLGPGGAERQLVEMARHADTERFEYEAAYLLPWKDHLVGELADQGVPSTCLRASKQLGVAWIARLRSLVRARGIELVHAHLPSAGIGARAAFRRSRTVRVISTEHNVWSRYRPLTRTLNSLTFGWQDAAIAVSDEVARSIGPRKRPPVHVIRNGVDGARLRAESLSREDARDELGLPPEAVVVGVVGGITPKKGHGQLVRAAPTILRSVPSARFAFVGLESDGGAVRGEVARAGLSERVAFAGYRAEAARLMPAFDLVCLPSVFEGLPVSMLEAMAVGVPVVAMRVGGVPEVASDGEAVLVPPGDAGALGDAVAATLTDSHVRDRLSEAGRAAADRFDIERTMRRIEELYLAVAGAGA